MRVNLMVLSSTDSASKGSFRIAFYLDGGLQHPPASRCVRNLAGILLGFRVPKGTKTSNWAARELSAAQITYAATDAWACRELYLRFQSLGLLASSGKV